MLPAQLFSGGAAIPDKSLTPFNRRPSAPLWHGSGTVRRAARQDPSREVKKWPRFHP